MPRKPEHTDRFRIVFDRIGRNHNPDPLELDVAWGENTSYPYIARDKRGPDDPHSQDALADALADAVYRAVRGKVASQGLEAHVFENETGELGVTLVVGIGHCAGRGTITRLDEPAVTP